MVFACACGPTSTSRRSPNHAGHPASAETYGMFVATTAPIGTSAAPDPRWSDDDLSTIRNVHGRDFEVVYTGDPVTH